MTQFLTTADGLRLAFDDQGSGLPLLCLAGLTRNRADFDTVLPLTARCRIIRLDSRGRGQSDTAPWQSYTVLQEATDAMALLDHLALDRVAILGTSRGGLIAMLLAALHKSRLTGVFLNDIGPVIDPAGLEAIKTHIGIRPRYADYDAAAAGLSATMAKGFPGVALPQWRVLAQRLYRETPDGLDLRYDPALRELVLNGPPASDLWPLFDALSGLPVAVLRGANSDLLSAQTLAQMTARHSGLMTATVPDRGHVPFLDEAESMALLHSFLDRLG